MVSISIIEVAVYHDESDTVEGLSLESLAAEIDSGTMMGRADVLSCKPVLMHEVPPEFQGVGRGYEVWASNVNSGIQCP